MSHPKESPSKLVIESPLGWVHSRVSNLPAPCYLISPDKTLCYLTLSAAIMRPAQPRVPWGFEAIWLQERIKQAAVYSLHPMQSFCCFPSPV